VFCFIHQLPKGMRKSLYVKDDDFRLSFLHGNYITLSDLDGASFERIIEQRLSPLYISVHATDPELRHALLGRPRHSAEILPRLERLAKAGIRMHAQIVLCPDLNDGAHLERTVVELAPLHPHVATTAIVPVGLTRHRERLPSLRSLTADEARALVATAEHWQRRWLASSAAGSYSSPTRSICSRACRFRRRPRMKASRSPRMASASCDSSRTVLGDWSPDGTS